MAMVGKRTDPVRLFLRRLGLLFLLIVVLGALSALTDVYKKERDSHILRLQAEAQYDILAKQEQHLSNEISRLQTARGKEEILRENYEMAKPGENLIIIIEPPVAEIIQSTSTPTMWWVHRMLPFWYDE